MVDPEGFERFSKWIEEQGDIEPLEEWLEFASPLQFEALGDLAQGRLDELTVPTFLPAPLPGIPNYEKWKDGSVRLVVRDDRGRFIEVEEFFGYLL